LDNWVNCQTRAQAFSEQPYDAIVCYKDRSVGTAGYFGGGLYVSYHYKDGRFVKVSVSGDITHWQYMPKPPGERG